MGMTAQEGHRVRVGGPEIAIITVLVVGVGRDSTIATTGEHVHPKISIIVQAGLTIAITGDHRTGKTGGDRTTETAIILTAGAYPDSMVTTREGLCRTTAKIVRLPAVAGPGVSAKDVLAGAWVGGDRNPWTAYRRLLQTMATIAHLLAAAGPGVSAEGPAAGPWVGGDRYPWAADRRQIIHLREGEVEIRCSAILHHHINGTACRPVERHRQSEDGRGGIRCRPHCLTGVSAVRHRHSFEDNDAVLVCARRGIRCRPRPAGALVDRRRRSFGSGIRVRHGTRCRPGAAQTRSLPGHAEASADPHLLFGGGGEVQSRH